MGTYMKFDDFQPSTDDMSIAVIKHLESMGAVGVSIYTFEDMRVIRSLEPVGVKRFLWHVSVSGDGRMPTRREAVEIAEFMLPAVNGWEVESQESAIHCWEIE